MRLLSLFTIMVFPSVVLGRVPSTALSKMSVTSLCPRGHHWLSIMSLCVPCVMVGPRDGTGKAMLWDTMEGTWCPLTHGAKGWNEHQRFMQDFLAGGWRRMERNSRWHGKHACCKGVWRHAPPPPPPPPPRNGCSQIESS